MNIIKPNPRPFCGHVGVDFVQGSAFRWMHAECGSCGARGHEIRVQTLGEGTPEQWRYDAEQEAFNLWNERAP
jgi:hypothetical protein